MGYINKDSERALTIGEYLSVFAGQKDESEESIPQGQMGEIFNDYANNKAYAGSHAEGSRTTASGIISHAEGSGTTASGIISHAEGSGTTAYGDTSHAEGINSIAKGVGSHAEGNSYTFGINSHAEGHHNLSPSIDEIFGSATTASEFNSTVSGTTGQSVGIAIGEYSHIEGNQTTAYGNYSHAEGISTIAYGDTSHAEGRECRALGGSSHAEGYNTIAPNLYSHACGFYNAYTTGTTGTTTATLWACGCGKPSARKNALEIKMNGDVQGIGFYQVTSDKREKHDISYLTNNEIDNVMKLKPCTFVYNGDKEERVNYGFIAQDVEEIYPEMVNSSDKEKLHLKYEAIIPVLCKAIQELKQELDSLKREK